MPGDGGLLRRAAERIATHLDAGRDVALLAEGDPLFYSSYMHMHTRLTERFDAVIVPGVTSVSAASAATGTPLVQGDEVLTILPGTLPAAELTRRLADTDAAVIMKLGKSYPEVREALSATKRLDRAFYVERASTDQQRVLNAGEVDEASVPPYFSIVMVPGEAAHPRNGRSPPSLRSPPRVIPPRRFARPPEKRQRRGGRAGPRRSGLDHSANPP